MSKRKSLRKAVNNLRFFVMNFVLVCIYCVTELAESRENRF